ncbi:adhesion G-protein coupled receptor D2 isoform X2 [Triplophysa rosa]|uniref:adhesion G-protein coupled receptor D2 isoform X2 n=1 Tax=Triplophysa rosa TaxID=992332 RepID=UPI0025462400|nr:adhesion G-protein coupled receptor D2 isoform X2 [Triplophysa rosa]
MDAWSPEDHHTENNRRRNSKYTYVKMSTLLFGVILANAMIVGMCEQSDMAESGFLDTADSNLLIHKKSVYQLVDATLGFDNALKNCKGQFGELTLSELNDDEEGAQQLLTRHNLKGPIWFQSRNAKNPMAGQVKKKTVLPGLSFKFKDGFARMNASFPSLSAVSVCARVQWDPRHENISTVFSYASPVFTNEFQLRGQIEETRPNKPAKKVRLALLIQGNHPAYKAELPLDENWHHVCVTWRRHDTFWAIYVDGKESDSGTVAADPQDIHGDGIFIVGQDQDTFGGTFTEPFVGNLTDLNIWDGALELKEVKELEACSELTNHRAIFRWEDWNLTVHPSVKNLSATLDCPDPQKPTQIQKDQCTIFSVSSDGRHEYSTTPCTHTYPFICKFSKECYVKMKDVKESLKSNPSSFMQHLMKLGMSADDVFSDTVDGQSWTSVSHLLNVSEQAVSMEPKGLEGRDIISLMRVLSRASNLPSTANKSCHDAERLGQSFINLADSLLNQDNATWNSIKEVVKGPMAVIQNVDRMVTNLNSLLMNDTDIVQIQSENIKLQVQQKILSEGSGFSAFCGSDVGNGDCISVPAKDMKELHNNGYRKVTLLNTWYNSVKCFSDIQQNITLPPTATDGSLKMVLGSSIISSAVLRDGQYVSIAVQFTLRHITEETSKEIICAFWDFNLTQGGGWSKKGCFKILSQNNSTTCYCNHTTNFALLLQIEDVEGESHYISLQIFSFIASGVSLCGLTFTFILFIALGVPKSDRTTVHKNLIVALAVSQLLLIFSDWAAKDQKACWLVTVLLHLFFLSSFCWMLVEGLLLWSKVVSVNISEERRMKLYYVLGWGLPVVIVAVTLAVTLDRYKAEEYCWLNVKSAVIWAFAGPVLFVVSVNAVVLFRVVMVTVASARRKAKMLTPSSDSKLHTLDLTWAATRPVLILLPVLGLTWLCGVLVHLSVVLAYIFIILNGFQGLYIFLVYAVYNSEVRNAIKRIQEKRKALSFTNCSQPTSFMPSQKSPSESWVHSLPTHSSPDNSESSTPMSRSLVFKNERFKEDNIVSVSLKAANGNQVVQLTAFKPSD